MVAPGLVSPHQTRSRPDEYARLRQLLLSRFDDIAAVTAVRHTQTNEAGRLAVVLPALARLQHRFPGQEFALIEVGASAGLALHPNAWRFHYVNGNGKTLAEFGPPHSPEITVTVKHHPDEPDREHVPDVVVPEALPPIAWRLGVDLNPLNPANPDDAEWLRTLVWPGQSHRLTRLDHALAAARHDPVTVLPRDITTTEVLDEVLAMVPDGLMPVVMHGAVLAYLPEKARRDVGDRILAKVRAGRLHWISNEGATVVPQITEALHLRAEFEARLRPGAFVVAVDGVPAYQADGHASWIL